VGQMNELELQTLTRDLARITIASCFALAGFMTYSATAHAATIRYSGRPAELSISTVSDYTVQIALTPLEENGKARTVAASTVLVEQQPQLKLRCRELSGEQTVSAGKLRLEVKARPLTISVKGPAGKVVQELVFAEADGTMSFLANAMILGMGEGARQFDRRGGLRVLSSNGIVYPCSTPSACSASWSRSAFVWRTCRRRTWTR
jgi:hypothetical protein